MALQVHQDAVAQLDATAKGPDRCCCNPRFSQAQAVDGTRICAQACHDGGASRRWSSACGWYQHGAWGEQTSYHGEITFQGIRCSMARQLAAASGGGL